MDNIAIWNIRGLNEPCKQFAMRQLLFKNNLAIAVILETRVKEINKNKVLAGSWYLELLR